jgi:hypothetical protein
MVLNDKPGVSISLKFLDRIAARWLIPRKSEDRIGSSGLVAESRRNKYSTLFYSK